MRSPIIFGHIGSADATGAQKFPYLLALAAAEATGSQEEPRQVEERGLSADPTKQCST